VFAEEMSDEPVSVKAAAANGALEKATNLAGRRKAAAQASLFDLVNQKVIEEIRVASATITPEEARDLLLKLKFRLM
jgi:beta-lactamase class D